ncbi:MAG: HDOD domain-containing protein [Lachnospiraceae bacterium]|nr:HDOD domain-containing protein [Lachnospiraceae bacterium]
MIATLIPLFDNKQKVRAYSILAQRENHFLQTGLIGLGYLDGANIVAGFDIVDTMGVETLSGDGEVFVELNNISVFTDLDEQCHAPHEKLVLMVDDTITTEDMYVNRLRDLKEKGYQLAIRNLAINQFEPFRQILSLMDYILLNHRKIKIDYAKIYFGKVYPNIRLCAVGVDTQEDYDKLTAQGGYDLYEGRFFRTPVNDSDKVLAPLKVNYIHLLNVVNEPDFDLTAAADVIGRDTALILSVLEIANRLSRGGEITSVQHAVAMLGQKELKKWINTAVTKELCADKPNELTRFSLLRAKFAENLAPVFNQAMQAQELFLMGLFSTIDIMLDKPIEEALDMVQVSKNIREALLTHDGILYPILHFMLEYENAAWTEVFRILVVEDIDMNDTYKAYLDALAWYRELFT